MQKMKPDRQIVLTEGLTHRPQGSFWTKPIGVTSLRFTGQLLDIWKHQLAGDECILRRSYCNGSSWPDLNYPFPSLKLLPDFKDV